MIRRKSHDFRRHERRDEVNLAPGEGISLSASEAIEIGEVRDLAKLFAVLMDAFPRDCVLYLEGTDMAAPVVGFLVAASAEPSAAVTKGTEWPESLKFHLPMSRANLMQMHQLSVRHAKPEICDHLVVYRDERVLLSAYDAGFDNVYARADLPEVALDRLRQAAA